MNRSVGASIAKSYIYIRSSLGQYTEDGLSQSAPSSEPIPLTLLTNTLYLVLLTGISIWNLVEVEIGIVAACGPLLRPIIVRAFSPLTSFIASNRRSTSKISHSKESHELPRFVRMPDSEVRLATEAKSVSVSLSERNGTDQYETHSTSV